MRRRCSAIFKRRDSWDLVVDRDDYVPSDSTYVSRCCMALDLGLDGKRGRYERCLTKLTARDVSYRGESDV